jgi:hypothetical protein
MSDDNGACDEQAQAKVAWAVRGSASEWLKDLGLSVGGNRVSVVVDSEPHALARLGRDESHGRLPAVSIALTTRFDTT